jgi:hypothetical protein
MPKSFLDARLSARLSALEAARDAALVGDDDMGGAFGWGGGGNVLGSGESAVGKSVTTTSSVNGDGGIFLSRRGRRRAALISG